MIEVTHMRFGMIDTLENELEVLASHWVDNALLHPPFAGRAFGFFRSGFFCGHCVNVQWMEMFRG